MNITSFVVALALSTSLFAADDLIELKGDFTLEQLSKRTFQIQRPLTMEEMIYIREKCYHALKEDSSNLVARKLLEYIYKNEGPCVSLASVSEGSKAENRVLEILKNYCFNIEMVGNRGATGFCVGERLAEPMRVQLAKAVIAEGLDVTLFDKCDSGKWIHVSPQIVLLRNQKKTEQGAAANP